MAHQFEPPLSPARPFLEIRPLLRALGIASDARKLILGAVGILAIQGGWSLLARAFGQTQPGLLEIPKWFELTSIENLTGETLGSVPGVIIEPFRVVTAPFLTLFRRGTGLSSWFQAALMGLWAVMVWGIAGGALARIAVVQAAGDHRVGLRSAIKFALQKALSLIGAPLTPLFAVALFAVGAASVGLIARIPWGIGSTLAAVLGFVPLFLGLAMALILVGLAVGWPLMHATVAAEGEDAPDALSRSYSYVNQRLARFTIHGLASLVIGSLGVILVTTFAGLVIHLAEWGVELGGGSIFEPADRGGQFWLGVVGLFVHAWVYSYFWTSASIIYLILRSDVDGTSWHDVYLTEHDTDTFAGDLDSKVPEPPHETALAEIS